MYLVIIDCMCVILMLPRLGLTKIESYIRTEVISPVKLRLQQLEKNYTVKLQYKNINTSLLCSDKVQGIF